MKNTFILIEKNASLKIKNQQLVISYDEDDIIVPMEDITIILLNHYQITLTNEVIVFAQKNNIALIISDEKKMPNALFLPYVGNTKQTKIINAQSALTNTEKNRLWKMIVKAKITNQYKILEKNGIVSNKFKNYISLVELGDKTNIEAQAAKMYFSLLFGKDFKRDKDGNDVLNIYLNYSYAISRGMVARSICSTGLHPSLSVWHSNQFDPMPLSNDLIEPLRPIIDGYIKDYIRNKDLSKLKFEKQNKEHLIKLINETCILEDKATTLINAMPIYISSFKNIICKEGKPFLKLPKVNN